MKNIILVANAHLDPVWLWRWQEGCAEALSTFRSACEMTDEFPGFIFNHNESILYEWVRENDPDLFERIQQKAASGQWHIMGGWYLQPDCNMPSGESFVRNIEEGQRFFWKYFHVRPTTAINFDSFGHSRGLVQILTKAGYDSYVVCRPGKQYYDFPQQDFIFEGLDGSRILVHRSDENYNSVWGHAAQELEKFLSDTKDEKVSLFLWGVGDHGGGPSRKDLQDLKEFMEKKAEQEGVHVIHSAPEAYFQELRASDPSLPVVSHALNPVSPGCYTSQIRVKQKHRLLENEIYSAEKMAAAAKACSEQYVYPQEEIEESVRDLLFSEFHDALPGSASHEVEEDTLRLLDHGLETMSRVKMHTFLTLAAGQERVKDGTTPFLVYNPHPYPVEGIVITEMGLPKQNWTTDFMYPHAKLGDQDVPTQALMENSHFSLDWRKKVAVRTTLPPCSMQRFDVYWTPTPARRTYEDLMKEPLYTFDNGTMQVVINTRTGLLERYTVKGRTLLEAGSASLVCVDDTYSPWGFGAKESSARRQFQLLTPHECSEFCGILDRVVQPVRMIEDGEVETVIEAVFGLHDSTACIRYILPKEGSTFDLEVIVRFAEKQQCCKLVLRTTLHQAQYWGQVPFGRDRLPQDGTEAVSQKWCGLTDGKDSLAVINDGIYGSSCQDGIIGLSLLRSAGYTASDFVMGKAYQEDRFAERMEQGERKYHFRITDFDQIDSQALFFNETPYCLSFCPSGEGKKPEPFLTLSNPSVIVSALKKSHDDDDTWILRLYESEGKVQETRVQMPCMQIDTTVQIPANSVETFRIRRQSIEKTTLIEGQES